MSKTQYDLRFDDRSKDALARKLKSMSAEDQATAMVFPPFCRLERRDQHEMVTVINYGAGAIFLMFHNRPLMDIHIMKAEEAAATYRLVGYCDGLDRKWVKRVLE